MNKLIVIITLFFSVLSSAQLKAPRIIIFQIWGTEFEGDRLEPSKVAAYMSHDQGVFDYTMRLRSLAKDSSVMKIVSEINQITGKEIVFAGKINIMLNEQENSFAMLDLNSSEIINIKNLNEKKSNQGVLQINLGLNSDVIKATLEKYLEDVKLFQEQKRKSNEAAKDLSLNQSDENAINLINGT